MKTSFQPSDFSNSPSSGDKNYQQTLLYLSEAFNAALRNGFPNDKAQKHAHRIQETCSKNHDARIELGIFMKNAKLAYEIAIAKSPDEPHKMRILPGSSIVGDHPIDPMHCDVSLLAKEIFPYGEYLNDPTGEYILDAQGNTILLFRGPNNNSEVSLIFSPLSHETFKNVLHQMTGSWEPLRNNLEKHIAHRMPPRGKNGAQSHEAFRTIEVGIP